MGIGRSLYYIIYFYAGYEALAYKERISNILQKNTLALVLVVFIITFVFLTDLEKEIPNFYVGQNILVKTIWFSISNVLTKIYGFLGILSLYCFCVYYTNKNTLNPHIKKLDKYCFGVYLFQQFFLQAFYYHSLLPNIIESYLLPWICFTVALVISVLLSIFVKHQKIIGKLI